MSEKLLSADEALDIFEGWRSSSVHLTLNAGERFNGTLVSVDTEFVTVTSLGTNFNIPVEGTTFRKVTRNAVNIPPTGNRSDTIEIGLARGNVALLQLLSPPLEN